MSSHYVSGFRVVDAELYWTDVEQEGHCRLFPALSNVYIRLWCREKLKTLVLCTYKLFMTNVVEEVCSLDLYEQMDVIFLHNKQHKDDTLVGNIFA